MTPKPLDVFYQPPVELQRGDETYVGGDVLQVDGLLFRGEFFRHFAEPDPHGLYSIRRDGERVTVVKVGTLEAGLTHG